MAYFKNEPLKAGEVLLKYKMKSNELELTTKLRQCLQLANE
jgi:hypothetical protein